MVLADAPAACPTAPLVMAAAAVRSLPSEETSERELRLLVRAIRALQAELDRALVRIGARADELATSGASAPAGEVLLDQGQVSGRRARAEEARVAAGRRFPEAVERLGGEQLDALARRTGTLSDDELARLHVDGVIAGVIGAGTDLPVDCFDAAVKRAVDAVRADGGAADAAVARDSSEFRHWLDRRTGMGHLTGRLDAERYEVLVGAVEAHTAALAAQADEPTSKNANLAATALVDLVAGARARTPGGSRRAEVIVVVDAETLRDGFGPGTLAQSGRGVDLAEQAVARLCCDAVLRRVITDTRGVPIDVGRAHRTATDAQWAALRALHATCAWFGCSRPIDHCQIHHIREWERGGPTDLANLVPLCSGHHHRVHEGRWSIRLDSDRRLVITRPDGSHHVTTARPTRTPPTTWQAPGRPPPDRPPDGPNGPVGRESPAGG